MIVSTFDIKTEKVPNTFLPSFQVGHRRISCATGELDLHLFRGIQSHAVAIKNT